MKPNLKDVKLPKTWGQINIDGVNYGFGRERPWRYDYEVSRIITNVRKRYLRSELQGECLTWEEIIDYYTNDLRKALQLRSRARKGR